MGCCGIQTHMIGYDEHHLCLVSGHRPLPLYTSIIKSLHDYHFIIALIYPSFRTLCTSISSVGNFLPVFPLQQKINRVLHARSSSKLLHKCEFPRYVWQVRATTRAINTLSCLASWFPLNLYSNYSDELLSFLITN